MSMSIYTAPRCLLPLALSPSLSPHPSPSSLSTLKQCLHYDPDSKPCLTLRRLVKKLDKGFTQLDDLLQKEDWKGVLKQLVAGGKGGGDLYEQWEQALEDNVGEANEGNVLPLVPVNLVQSTHEDPQVLKDTTKKDKKKKPMPPIHLPDAKKHSPQRQHLLRALCKSYIHLADVAPSSTTYASGRAKYCSELLTVLPEDVDALVGKGETLLATPASAAGSDSKEDGEGGGNKLLEEAVRVFEQAFEKSGRTDRDVHRRLEKAMAKLKRSKQKDYYKIVGVDRSAGDKEIKRAL
jgi:DnaJ homolog subfamily C member 3